MEKWEEYQKRNMEEVLAGRKKRPRSLKKKFIDGFVITRTI